jgi:hypothetical protein
MICRQDVSTWRTKGVLYRRSPNYKNYSSDIFIGGSQRSARCYWSIEGAQAANKVLRSDFRLIDTVLKRSVTFARCCHCILFYRGWLRLRTAPLTWTESNQLIPTRLLSQLLEAFPGSYTQ